MKFDLSSSRAAAVLALVACAEAAGHAHGHRHRSRHQRPDIPSEEVDVSIEKRGGKCQFPSDAGLVAITPHMENAGWAMSPNQPCRPGNYCPYACPAGQVSMQWDPKATSYTYPMSMNGGLYCDEDGNIQKPFPDRPYCQDGTGSVAARNSCGKEVAFCQTVLPGNEAMLIPTLVRELETLAVPGTEYWCETAAHYYINPPGISTDVACVWGTPDNPYGNWSPYVAGANTVSNGDTYVKIGWNPIYLEPTTPFRDVMPDFGVEIVCEGGSCNGLPCKIDPDVNKVNEMIGGSNPGAGGANFCVVTVPKGEKAHVVVFEKGGSGSGGSSGSSSSSTSIAVPSTPSPSTSSTPSPTPSTTTTPSTTPTPSTTSTSNTPSSSTVPTSTESSSTVTPTTPHSPSFTPSSVHSVTPSSSAIPSSSKWAMTSPSASHTYTYKPHAFVESGEPSESAASSPSMSTSSPDASETATSAASTATFSMLSMILTVITLAMNA